MSGKVLSGKVLAVLTALCISAAPLGAETVNLSGLPPGDLGTSAAAGAVTFDSTTNLVNMSDQHFTAAGGAICASKGATTNNCRGAYNIRFGGKVNRLSFFSAGYQAGDNATIVVYRGKNVIGSTGFGWNGKVDLTIYKRVTRIRISYEGVEDGMAIGKINFNRAAASPKARAERKARKETQR